jgi:FkbM family methyltransferase
MRIFIRHPGLDALVNEVFARDVYRPPQPVGRMLRALNRLVRIIDIGAHIGLTTLMMLERFPAAQVTAFEPNFQNVALLRRAICANGLAGQCEVHRAAAGVAAGDGLLEDSSALSHLARGRAEIEVADQFPFLGAYQRLSTEPQRVDVVDILPYLEDADLVKIDIEGGEWPILADPRFRELRARAVVLEYHPQGAPDADPAQAASRRLADAGFEHGEPLNQHDGYGLIWAWRKRVPAGR